MSEVIDFKIARLDRRLDRCLRACAFWLAYKGARECVEDGDPAIDPQLPWVKAELRAWVMENIDAATAA